MRVWMCACPVCASLGFKARCVQSTTIAVRSMVDTKLNDVLVSIITIDSVRGVKLPKCLIGFYS